MKLFLTSHYLEKKHFDAFKNVLGKPKASRALFITTASVPYGHGPKPEWLIESLNDMSSLTDSYDETSLEKNDFMPEDLKRYDFIFVAGGNSFYLAYKLAEIGLDKKIKKYILEGGMYSGNSAGAIVLMENINNFSPVDDPTKAPRICSGLGIIDVAVIPHADSEKYASAMKKIAHKYKKEGKEVFIINDDQVLIVDGDQRSIV